MEKGKELKLHVWLEWLCESCNKRQDMIENEDWQMCCNNAMKMQPYKKFIVQDKIN